MFYVFRFKCDIIIVNNDNIVIRKIFGLGNTIIITFNDIEFVPSWEHVKIGNGAKLLVINEGKRITELSDFSYSNYNELLKIIMKNTTTKPFQTDSFLNRLKHAIRFS